MMFFSLAFFYRFERGLGRVWGRFWEGFGTSWRLLGHFLGSFFDAFIWNALQKGSWRLLGLILARFWRIWEASWERFGEVLGFKKQVLWKVAWKEKLLEALNRSSHSVPCWIVSYSNFIEVYPGSPWFYFRALSIQKVRSSFLGVCSESFHGTEFELLFKATR